MPPLPCPLLANKTVVQQPINYTELTGRYVKEAVDFISTSLDVPSLLYFAPGHTHAWNFAGPRFWKKSKRGAYGDALAELDWAVGEIATAVRQSGRETLVFFTSDNGAAWPHRYEHAGSTGPLRCGKGTAYEGGVRVPAIAWWPGHIAAATMSTETASTLDIFPTLLNLAANSRHSAVQTQYLDGRDITGQLLQDSSRQPKPSPLLWYAADQVMAVRIGAHKVHFRVQGWGKSWELFPECGPQNLTELPTPVVYQVEHDPSERFPLDEQSDEYKQALKAAQAAVQNQAGSFTPGIATPELDAVEDANTMLCCNGKQPFPPSACTCAKESGEVLL